MSAYHVRIIEGGKIVIPAVLRRKHGFAVGQTLVVQDSDNGVTIHSLDEAISHAQAIMAKIAPPDRVLSDELIADRRRETARE